DITPVDQGAAVPQLVFARVADQDTRAVTNDERARRGAEDERRPVVRAGGAGRAERVDVHVQVLHAQARGREVLDGEYVGEALPGSGLGGQQEGVGEARVVHLG